jgi:hypothetical protein
MTAFAVYLMVMGAVALCLAGAVLGVAWTYIPDEECPDAGFWEGFPS